MSGAVTSRLDPSAFHLLRGWRRCRERDAKGKLELLRRLERQKVIRDLPETRVEQSFNEQLFAQVLGFRTLLSSDNGTFHLMPKNAVGPHRFDDFSLGFFGGERDPVVRASAEFKSPGTDLSKSQTGRGYKGKTPVEQGLSAAAAIPTCRWVIVSNFRDLLLFDTRSPNEPVVRSDLHEVRTKDDLAGLCAHFDKEALLGDTPMSKCELEKAVEPGAPGSPLVRADEAYRLVIRFTPAGDERVMPLSVIEGRIREAVESFFPANRVKEKRRTGRSVVKLEMHDGWVSTECCRGGDLTIRIAASRFGQVVVSARIRNAKPAHQIDTIFTMYESKRVALVFLRTCHVLFDTDALTRGAHQGTRVKVCGEVGMDLLDVAGWVLHETVPQHAPSVWSGRSAQDLFAGDFPVIIPASLIDGVARNLCDLAIQFRADQGGVPVDYDALGDELLARTKEPEELFG